MMTKSAVPILKEGDWQERGPVTDQCHDRSEKPDKRSDKKLGQNSSKRQSSDARQLGCVFQDMTPPKSILRKGTDMPKQIQHVKFTIAIARHTKIRDHNPSLGFICPSELHERSPNAPKFEDRSQEETEWKERCAREAAGKLAKNEFKLKEHERPAFFSSPENRCLPDPTPLSARKLHGGGQRHQGDGHTGRSARKGVAGAKGAEGEAHGKGRHRNVSEEMWEST